MSQSPFCIHWSLFKIGMRSIASTAHAAYFSECGATIASYSSEFGCPKYGRGGNSGVDDVKKQGLCNSVFFWRKGKSLSTSAGMEEQLGWAVFLGRSVMC